MGDDMYRQASSLEVKLAENKKYFEEQFYSIDFDNTHLHDDAIAITQLDKHTKEVHIAISGIGNRTNYYTQELPIKFKESRPHSHKAYSLDNNKQREAIVLSYITDGTTLDDIQLQQGIVIAQDLTHETLTNPFKRDLLEATQAGNTHDAVGIINLTYNTIIAQLAHTKEMPIPYLNRIGHHKFYSAEPVGHQGLGLSAYTRVSSPLRRSMDRVAQRQVYEYIKNSKSIMNKKTIQKFCDHYNTA